MYGIFTETSRWIPNQRSFNYFPKQVEAQRFNLREDLPWLLDQKQNGFAICQSVIKAERFSNSHSVISDFASEIESEDVVCIWRIRRFGNCLDGLLWRPLGVFPILASSAKISSRQYKSAIHSMSPIFQSNQFHQENQLARFYHIKWDICRTKFWKSV